MKLHFFKVRLCLFFSLLFLLVLLGCPFCRFLSFQCPGCGLTRAWLSFLRGDFEAAYRYNPFFLTAPIFILLYTWKDRTHNKQPYTINLVLFVFAISMAVYHLFIR